MNSLPAMPITMAAQPVSRVDPLQANVADNPPVDGLRGMQPADLPVHPRGKGHHLRVSFSAPRPGGQRSAPSPRLGQAKLATVGAKPRSGSKRVSQAEPGQTSESVDRPEEEDVDDDFDSRRVKLGYAIRTNSSDGGDRERGAFDEGGHQERRFLMIQKTRRADLPSPVASAAARSELAALRNAGSIEVLAGRLQGVVRRLGALGGPAALPVFVLRAAAAWLARRGAGDSGGSATLSSVRAALIDRPERADLARTERQAVANVWLPVFLLNLDRPRTPEQKQQAIERLDMIERKTAAIRGATVHKP